MNTLSYPTRKYSPLDIYSDVLVTINNNRIQMKANGKYVILRGKVLRALLSLSKNTGTFSAVSKMIKPAETIFRHVDINICLYSKRFAVIGPETKPAVNRVKSLIVRYFERK